MAIKDRGGVRSKICVFSALCLATVLLAACNGGGGTTAQPTAVAIVRPLATIGPTVTLSEGDFLATQAALPPTRTPPSLVSTSTPTPYIGVFQGEAAFNPLAAAGDISPQEFLALPTEAQPQSIPLLCGYQQDPQFGTEWEDNFNLREEMACPIQEVSSFEGRVQFFENGVMYFNPFTNDIWAIAPGEPGGTGEFWSTGMVQEVSPAVVAPEGLRVPQGPFGAIWATIPQVREALGFATTQEQANDLMTQRFFGGTLLLDVVAGQVFVLTVDGDAFGPF
jgi:hypothetical protein